jgi:[ribosomal protein S5]-alanine N-acetyltransferase
VLPDGYEIRALNEADASALAAAYCRNRAHLAPWEPVRGEDFYSADGQAAAVRATLAAAAEGAQDPWLVMYGADVVGRITLSNIVRGMFLSASIGYWTDRTHTGRGLATEAVGFAVRRADELGLHRVEAGTLVHNLASQRVLLTCGFERVGLAREYLFIAGQWQDHEIFQRILNDRPA